MGSDRTPSPDHSKPGGQGPGRTLQGNASKVASHRKGASDPSGAHPAPSKESIERGYRRHRYDFDVQNGGSEDEVSPMQAKQRPVAHKSDVTTFTDLIKHGARSRSASPETSLSRPAVSALVEPRDKRRPTPLDLRDARKYSELMSQRKKLQAVHNPLKTPAEAERWVIHEDGSSSLYSDERVVSATPTVSPLCVKKRPNAEHKMNFLKAYHDWKGRNTPAPASAILKSPFRSKSATVHDMPTPAETESSSARPPSRRARGGEIGILKSATANNIPAGNDQAEPFSPLTPWLVGSGDGHTRKASKTLFGNRGWLQDTTAAHKKPEPQKATGFLDGIKKKARELVSSPPPCRFGPGPD